jgi:hypothetical protein
MIMVTVVVGTFALEEVEIAELQLLEAGDLVSGNGLKIQSIYALAVSVAFHDLRRLWSR